MNKKGALLHWAIFGLLVVGGLIFIQLMGQDPGLGVRGAWAFSFISTFQDAEADLLQRDLNLRNMAEQALQDLSARLEETSDCGRLEGAVPIALLNTPDRFCNPDFPNLFLEEFKIRVEQQYPGQFAEIKFSGSEIIGISTEDKVFEELVGGIPAGVGLFPYTRVYKYNHGFRINLEPEFALWRVILSEGPLFLDSCRGNPNLETCIRDNSPSATWGNSYNDCSAAVEQIDRKVTFCLISEEGISYRLALDFSRSD